MSIRTDWQAYRDANLAAFKARHRGSLFAGTARSSSGHTVVAGQQGSRWGTKAPS